MINVIWQSHLVYVYAMIYQNIMHGSSVRASFISFLFFFFFFFFLEFRPRKSLDQWEMTFGNTLGLSLSTLMRMQRFIKIFHTVQEIRPVNLLFQNLDLDKASSNDKWHLTIPWARSCQYWCVCNISSKYSKRFKRSLASQFTFSELGPRQRFDQWK